MLQDNYDDVVATFAREEPQLVPPEIVNRSHAGDPDKVIASGVLEQLRGQPAQGPDLEALRSLQGTVTYLSAPYDNPPWPPPKVSPTSAKKAATKKTAAPKNATGQAAKRPTLTVG